MIRAANDSLPSPLLGRGAGGEWRFTFGFHSHEFGLEGRRQIAPHPRPLSPQKGGEGRKTRLRLAVKRFRRGASIHSQLRNAPGIRGAATAPKNKYRSSNSPTKQATNSIVITIN